MTTPAPDASDEDAQGEDHVERRIDRLSIDEKIDLLHGSFDPDGIATGYVEANERVGTPSMSLVDGPMGIRAVPATAFPASMALAASWDPDLAREFGEALGEEARGADQDVLLAPGFNVARVPQCGRNFEYYSEDPHLNSRLAVGTVEGVQSAGVMATAKHYVANNQETDRHHISAEISERALREVYLPAFEAAVKEADAASVMAAYNRINGTYAPQHRRLLTDVLREEWGFDGFVVSDWWATHDGPAAAEAGLDLDMPGMPVYEWQEHGSPLLAAVDALPDEEWFPKKRVAELATEPWQPENPNPNVLDESPFDDPLREAVESGGITEDQLDEKLRRIFRQMDRFGLFDGNQPEGAVDTPEHHDLAQRVAERGTVLLRNEDETLPLDGSEDVALIGPHGDEPKVGGGGSSEVDAKRTTSPLEGIQARADASSTVTFECGIPEVGDASMHDSLLPEMSNPFEEEPRIEEAMEAARDADVAVVVVRDAASEGVDRELGLPGAQDELITAVSAVADRTVVVLNTAGMVEMPWLDDVDAALEAWYPGQEDGKALASILYGDSDPSGRLPVTFGATADDYPASSPEQYPGDGESVEYSEGVFVGYRHFDEEAIDPVFPFGHGLSYADFEYGDLTVDVDGDADAADGPTATVEVTVENVGDHSGRDVVQVYLGARDSDVERPPKELAAFEPVELDADESETVTLDVDSRALAYYDEDAGDWVVDDGEFEVLVGRSAENIRLEETVYV